MMFISFFINISNIRMSHTRRLTIIHSAQEPVPLMKLHSELSGEKVVDKKSNQTLNQLQAVTNRCKMLVLNRFCHICFPYQAWQKNY